MAFTNLTITPTKNRKNLIRLMAKLFSQWTLSTPERINFDKFLKRYDNILVLTGAGVSTESGIPDYRSKGVGLFERTTYKPIDYAKFVKSKDARVRYWARSYVGWPEFSIKEPNKTHGMISFYQSIPDKISGIITQNVDGLHHKAGSKDVIELHGNLFWVNCLQCNHLMSRNDFQKILDKLNPDLDMTSNFVRPDGDVEIDEEIYKHFKVPDCECCGGILKPTVVFFGDNVSPKIVKKVENLVERSDALLVMGTSLSTLSSFRIVSQAYDLCKFICIVNLGPTRGDKMADLLINSNCSDIFRIAEAK